MIEREEVKKLAKEEFLEKAGVIGISVKHHSPKILRIYVEKLDPALLKTIPKTYLGYEVQVIEVGRIKPLLSAEERQKRHRPVFPGLSIGSVRVTAGTLTGICKDNVDGEYVLLSNYHVFYGTIGEHILSPGPYDGGQDPQDLVGYLKRYVSITPSPSHNYVDSAIASVEVDFISDEPDLGSPLAIREVREGETIVKAGRTTAVTRARVIDDAATIKVYDYPGVGTVIFDDVIITDYMAAGGDSGSTAFSTDGFWVGQCFAGSDKITAFIKSTRIINALNITPIYGTPRIIALRAGMLPIVAMALIPFIPIPYKRK